MSRLQKLSFKQQQLIVREGAIIDAVNGLLAKKGYDMMTMDEVAAEVGIAKASLYKHFPSKEALAAAAMIRLLENTLVYVRSLDVALPAISRLRAILGWALSVRMQASASRRSGACATPRHRPRRCRCCSPAHRRR